MLELTDLDGADLLLDGTGQPRQPAIVIGFDDFAHTAPEVIAAAKAVIGRAQAIVVAVGCDEPVPSEFVQIVDVVLARHAHAGDRVVRVDDPAGAAADLAKRIEDSPVAAVSLVWLLRESVDLDVAKALTAESALYSALLGGSRFADWLRERGHPRPPDGQARVQLSRVGQLLRVQLARPDRRNAFDARMRHALLEALELAVAEPDLQVEIDAAGPSFSAGGDLDEFGSAADLGIAHLIRVSASVGRAVYELRDRVQCRLHGACIGAGIEIPAFAGSVVAAPDTFFALPEVAMGLIPGAGGTVSIPRRIGRIRTTWLALSGARLDARTALRWGLIDAIE